MKFNLDSLLLLMAASFLIGVGGGKVLTLLGATQVVKLLILAPTGLFLGHYWSKIYRPIVEVKK